MASGRWLSVAAVLVSLSCSCQAETWSTVAATSSAVKMARDERLKYRDTAKEMFLHTYRAYIDNAYPADELMPLSCRGRWRHSLPSRGDIDEALGNFSLTLIDSLDSLVILGELDEFERAVRLVLRDVTFNTDLVVSVFETNIRVLGGLLSAHILAEQLRQTSSSSSSSSGGHMSWYRGQLLTMARDLGLRLLPAFNTSTGLPHSRVNLRHGVHVPQLAESRETCTACAGTLLLEFATLSRLLDESVFEDKAHAAMDSLWRLRHRQSQLVGTTINIHSGDWVRRDSGVGAGIDSYYEYCLKAYILLGDEKYLSRFHHHYRAVMKYVSQGPLLLDVLMHKPDTVARNFMDALLAFWPGLQVLMGDIRPAIETHEVLYQVMQKHNLLPEAFTTDFKVHWGQHLLRPELIESTYMLYRATGDHHYLRVGSRILDSLRQYARTQCGFAAVKDVRTGQQEDRLDSFVLAETFKYLYLLFADETDLPLDINQFVFSTEAHLLPLSLAQLGAARRRRPYHTKTSLTNSSNNLTTPPSSSLSTFTAADRTCPNTRLLAVDYARQVRRPLTRLVETGRCTLAPSGGIIGDYRGPRRLTASQFDSGNAEHVRLLSSMGVSFLRLSDGRLQFTHSPNTDVGERDAIEGALFMQEMTELAQQNTSPASNTASSSSAESSTVSRAVSFLSADNDGRADSQAVVLQAGPALFGRDLSRTPPISGHAVLVQPEDACSDISDATAALLINSVAVVRRGGCMFVDKVRRLQRCRVRAVVVIDNTAGTSARTLSMFSLSGDGAESDITVPVVFLYSREADMLLEAMRSSPRLIVTVSDAVSRFSAAVTTSSAVGRGQVTPIDNVQWRSEDEINSVDNSGFNSFAKLGHWLVDLLNLSSSDKSAKNSDAQSADVETFSAHVDRSRDDIGAVLVDTVASTEYSMLSSTSDSDDGVLVEDDID